ncbi:MAG: hypothetical protein H7235_09405 [Bdellovibrionaceae bacterium]|nr:hypothetical protein [Pseudobdellovibrionaceae bacterium]
MASSCQNYNSNSSDKLKYDDTPLIDSSGDPNFAEASLILKSKCISCHAGQHNSWIGRTSAQWISSGYVSRGSPDSSPLILATAQGGGSMPPPGSPALTSAEYLALRNWVTNIP